MKNNKDKKNKKIVFSETIDNSINGFALVCAFIIFGIILQFNEGLFKNVSNVVKVTFIVVGIIGLFTEINKLNLNYNIKGLDSIEVGLFLWGVIYLLKTFVDFSDFPEILFTLYEIFLFFIILLSIYGCCKGLIEMVYSLYLNYTKQNKKENLFSSAIIALTQLFGLALIVAQIYDIFK